MKYAPNFSVLYNQIVEEQPSSYSLATLEVKGVPVPLPLSVQYVIDFMSLEDVELKKIMNKFIYDNAQMLEYPNIVVGTWMTTDRKNLAIVLCDLSPDLLSAIEKAISRGLDKLFVTHDVIGTVVMDLPLPQTAGTFHQQRTYNREKARELYEKYMKDYGRQD